MKRIYLLLMALLTLSVSAGAKDAGLSFGKAKYGVSAAESVALEYSLPKEGKVEVECEGGWSAEVRPNGGRRGTIVITAPDPAKPARLDAVVVYPGGEQVRQPLPVIVKDPFTAATRPKANLMIFGGLDNRTTTPEDYQKVADAGFTMITLEGGDPMDMNHDGVIDNGDRMETIKYKLSLIKQAGLRYSLHHPILKESVELVKDDPDLTMIHIFDEPGLWQIPMLNERKAWVKAIAPDVPVHINLHPEASIRAMGTDSYRDYIETMAKGCDMEIISYDQYPIMADRTIMNYWYKCMEVNADVARKRGIPFWAFTASCYMEDEKRHIPDMANMRLQVYTDFAYGCEVVQYFVYRAYSVATLAPIMADGTYTELYDLMKEFNTEMHKRGFVFTGCKVSKTRFTHLTPWTCLPLISEDLPAEIASVDSDKTALVSFVENDGNEYVVVVNSSCFDKCTAEVEFASLAYTIDRNGTFTEHQPGKEKFTLDEGDMLVIKYR